MQRSGFEVFRYETKSLEAALIQKLARTISGLNASLTLLASGYVQELTAILRMLDEFTEDITFLCFATNSAEDEKLIRNYLDDFYQEDFSDLSKPFLSTLSRKIPPRKKIHAAIARNPHQSSNPSDVQALHGVLGQAHSGFVHAASVHILEMYGGNPPNFHISGMAGTPRVAEYERYLWNYFYRGLLALMSIALKFGEKDLLGSLYAFRAHIELESGNTDWPEGYEMFKNLKKKS